MKDLEELLNAIYIDIRKRNTDRGLQAIPQSDEFFEEIKKAYSLIPFAIPKLIKMLVDSHKIFTFPIVEADRKERIRRIEGLVVAEGNIVKDLLQRYSDELVRAYSHEFSTKYSVERIIKEFYPKILDYNNTHLGKMANIVMYLMGIQSNLERNIMQFGVKWQEKQLRTELENSDPIDYFIETESGICSAGGGVKGGGEQGPRATDAAHYEDMKRYLTKNSVEKTITVYGIEFYSRVCFREYQFSLMQKLIEDGIVHNKDDLKLVKKMLQKTRSNSDQDLNLQKYANDINHLEKLINNKIKLSEG
ncbi:MAG TPA: hypothetical protein PLC28_18030 [Spirochaetota bacterium]|nr:hypothetical protein [Spirochaetota bacterium]HQJ72798.1 hypothetical protein [Spirochaetota bacterium]